ncbi:cold-shock protein, partial [Lactiplantibacillus plantarum]
MIGAPKVNDVVTAVSSERTYLIMKNGT